MHLMVMIIHSLLTSSGVGYVWLRAALPCLGSAGMTFVLHLWLLHCHNDGSRHSLGSACSQSWVGLGPNCSFHLVEAPGWTSITQSIRIFIVA